MLIVQEIRGHRYGKRKDKKRTEKGLVISKRGKQEEGKKA